jgi:hypothetical protein
MAQLSVAGPTCAFIAGRLSTARRTVAVASTPATGAREARGDRTTDTTTASSTKAASGHNHRNWCGAMPNVPIGIREAVINPATSATAAVATIDVATTSPRRRAAYPHAASTPSTATRLAPAAGVDGTSAAAACTKPTEATLFGGRNASPNDGLDHHGGSPTTSATS